MAESGAFPCRQIYCSLMVRNISVGSCAAHGYYPGNAHGMHGNAQVKLEQVLFIFHRAVPIPVNALTIEDEKITTRCRERFLSQYSDSIVVVVVATSRLLSHLGLDVNKPSISKQYT